MLVQNIEDDQIYSTSRYEGWGSLLIWMQSWGDRMSRYHRNGVRGVGMWGDWQGSSVLPPVDMRCLSLSLSLCVSRCVSVHLCISVSICVCANALHLFCMVGRSGQIVNLAIWSWTKDATARRIR